MLELTVRLVVSLAIVVGLLLVLARVGQRKFRGAGDALVQIVHRQPLSRTSAVAVVTVGDRVLVLGTTEQQVSVLAELDPEDLGDGAGVDAAMELPAATTAGFATALDRALESADGGSLPAQQPATSEPAEPAKPAKPALPPRPQARPATKPPTWDPMLTICAQAAARPAPAPAPTTPPAAAAGGSSAAVDAILAAVEAHQNGAAVPPALAVLASESGAEEPARVDPETAKTAKTQRRRRPSRPSTPGSGPLAGSVLSPDTWKQAIAAATSRRAS